MNTEYKDIETREGHMAVNVKCYNFPSIDDQRIAELVWESLTERFWEDAREIARDCGYDFVFAEGRSGGWAVPFRQRAPRAANCYSWPGQGGQWGYPQYPDVDSIGERSRFRRFQRLINAWMSAIPDMARDEAEHYIHESA